MLVFLCKNGVCVCVCVCEGGGGQQLGLKNVESTDSKSFLATPQTQSNKNWLFMGWNTSVLQKKKTLISKSLKMQSPSLFRLVPLNFLFVHEDFKKDIFIQTVFFEQLRMRKKKRSCFDTRFRRFSFYWKLNWVILVVWRRIEKDNRATRIILIVEFVIIILLS